MAIRILQGPGHRRYRSGRGEHGTSDDAGPTRDGQQPCQARHVDVAEAPIPRDDAVGGIVFARDVHPVDPGQSAVVAAQLRCSCVCACVESGVRMDHGETHTHTHTPPRVGLLRTWTCESNCKPLLLAS